MKIVCSFLIVLISTPVAQAQVDDGKAVLEPVKKMFTGMNRGDSALVRAAFHRDAVMFTVMQDKDGNPLLRKEGLQRFLQAVGTPHPEPWSEPIWNTEVHVDGNLAQVWTNYAFYVGKRFSHCGVDAFQLFKDSSGNWKIFQVADTRQKDGCEVPDYIMAAFK